MNIDISARPSIDRTKKLLDEIYCDINGFCISHHECNFICEQGGAPTYGEITFEALESLFKDLKVTKNDVFCDLGCGVGKACAQSLLTTPIRKSIGVELSKTRISDAERAKERLQKKRKLGKKEFILREGNILDTNLDDVTIVYMASTCFSDELMKKVTGKLAENKNKLRVLTLKQLPGHDKFVYVKTYHLPMTWASNTPVYLYELKS
jgi:hypothetical protein